MPLMVPRFSSGMRRQRISFKFRSTADSASLAGNRVALVCVQTHALTHTHTHTHTHTRTHTHTLTYFAGSMVRLRFTIRGATLFCSFTSHPTTFGTPSNDNIPTSVSGGGQCHSDMRHMTSTTITGCGHCHDTANRWDTPSVGKRGSVTPFSSREWSTFRSPPRDWSLKHSTSTQVTLDDLG